MGWGVKSVGAAAKKGRKASELGGDWRKPWERADPFTSTSLNPVDSRRGVGGDREP